ncbi:hypothetical protein K435DRAFT_865340 [Dendrothele bispora CBS 962.96]|uniref:Uncharacterized protein n=1 Tax=Dendrothele bispora (strain CBS 962.96) TaxID=1314807 RepID=A0A4S8LKE0_DENBC|nr:hypothetical protein K435DRAFT_865340 [Dendrothele bispora CBS 962.96]
MSKRNGDVQVVDYIRRGWEPEAMLNWFALAGWGAHAPRPLQIQSAPESTRIMTRQELISEFNLSAITQRSSSLDATKLEYINKHHLMLKWRSSEEEGEGRWLGGGRLTNLQDIPTHAPWLFVEPDFSSPEAQKMLEQTKMTEDRRAGTLTVVHAFLRPKSSSPEAWNEYISQTNGEILEQLHGVVEDGPGLVDVIRVLGLEVTLKRFSDARGSQV